MMRKERNLRLAVSGILLLAVVAAGIGMYRADQKGNTKQDTQIRNEELAEETPLSDEETAEDEETESTDVNTSNAEAQMEGTEDEGTAENAETEEDASAQDETAADEAAAQDVQEVLPSLDFNDNTVMEWPVSGDVLIDYSMDGAVYFPTLEVYKYNPAVILSAQADQQVLAAANSKVLSVEEDSETGMTVTMDMGNGYQAVYGQLKDVTVAPEQTITAGTVIGTVAQPTKYYSSEGTNLYFALTKDGTAVDPFMYLPTEEE